MKLRCPEAKANGSQKRLMLFVVFLCKWSYTRSFIIPTYNRSSKLGLYKALFGQNFVKSEFEIVVVDDGSTDDTKILL